MLFFRELKPTLNPQTDSIRAELPGSCLTYYCLFGTFLLAIVLLSIYVWMLFSIHFHLNIT